MMLIIKLLELPFNNSKRSGLHGFAIKSLDNGTTILCFFNVCVLALLFQHWILLFRNMGIC